MKPVTHTLLLSFERADFFANCQTSLESDQEVQTLSSWDQAMEVCGSQCSEDATLAARNALTRQLSVRFPEAYHAWNPLVKEIRPLLDEIVRAKLASPKVHARIPRGSEKQLRTEIRYSLLGVCMAHEYEDLVSVSRFHLLKEQLYLAGHFPCGWIGEVPDAMEVAFQHGKLAVL